MRLGWITPFVLLISTEIILESFPYISCLTIDSYDEVDVAMAVIMDKIPALVSGSLPMQIPPSIINVLGNAGQIQGLHGTTRKASSSNWMEIFIR